MGFLRPVPILVLGIKEILITNTFADIAVDIHVQYRLCGYQILVKENMQWRQVMSHLNKLYFKH